MLYYMAHMSNRQTKTIQISNNLGQFLMFFPVFLIYYYLMFVWREKNEICRRGPILVILSLIVLNNLLIYTHKVIIKVCINSSNSFRFISNPDNFSSIVPLELSFSQCTCTIIDETFLLYVHVIYAQFQQYW